MRIIQISEFHLRSDGKLSFQKCDTQFFVSKTIDYLCDLPEYDLPEFFVVSGDLAEGGTREGLQMVRDQLARLPRPAYVIPGNHDKRDLYLEMLPDNAPVKADIAPYICYVVDEGLPIRSIFIDTSIPDTHWGGTDDRVCDWLQKQLDADHDRPTIVFGHHPPFTTGLPAMDEGFENKDRLAQVLSSHPNVIYCCGHLHTPLITNWHGVNCRVCPAVCMQMHVDFRPKDGPDVTEAEKADGFKGGGDAFFLANPAYYIHNLIEGQVNTHYVPIPVGADFSGPWTFKYYEGEH